MKSDTSADIVRILMASGTATIRCKKMGVCFVEGDGNERTPP
jgi:hypothetical protein